MLVHQRVPRIVGLSRVLNADESWIARNAWPRKAPCAKKPTRCWDLFTIIEFLDKFEMTHEMENPWDSGVRELPLWSFSSVTLRRTATDFYRLSMFAGSPDMLRLSNSNWPMEPQDSTRELFFSQDSQKLKGYGMGQKPGTPNKLHHFICRFLIFSHIFFHGFS